MNGIRMRFPGGRVRAFTMSYDDGVEQDARLIALMRKHGVKGTFNLNSGCYAAEGTVYPEGQIHRRMSLSACKKLYTADDIEVAVHGYTHPFLDALPAGLRTLEVIRDREALENDFGRIVRGAAYPYATYNDDTVACLKSCGIVYCRTAKSTHSFALPENWLLLHPTCHHDDGELFDLAEKFMHDNYERSPLMFYLWGHAYEFEAHDNWDRIEKLLGIIGGQADIWYATNIQIYDYVKAFESLQFSASGRRVFNPGCAPVWFYDGSVTHMVQSGEMYEF